MQHSDNLAISVLVRNQSQHGVA